MKFIRLFIILKIYDFPDPIQATGGRSESEDFGDAF
jgi:hypothetical protein